MWPSRIQPLYSSISAKVRQMNILLTIFLINMFLLIFGVFMSWLDIRLFGAGLYLALVSTVTVVIVLAFCLVGTDEQVTI